MSSLLSMMPAPTRSTQVFEEPTVAPAPGPASLKVIPPYGKRTGFVPRAVEDFGDGGAFPEIHVSQYPLNMGRPKKKGAGISSAIVSVDVDKDGEVKYDAIVKQGTNKDRKVFTSLDDIKAKEGDEVTLRLPTDEEEQEAAEKTRRAIEGIIGAKVAASKPFTVPKAAHAQDAQFIQYTPNPNAPGASKTKQRVIRMVEEQIDPMEPAKNKHRKVPRGPPEDPVPILHSPQRKVTVKDQQSWKIPPCISNWKNVGGYTIPLDKRLAADGRGLQEQTINNNFATLTEALYIAERKAREELEYRATIKQRIAIKEKEQKENELREIAARARMARAGLDTGDSTSDRKVDEEEQAEAEPRGPRSDRRRRSLTPDSDGGADRSDGEEEMDPEALAERERMRVQRRKEREREMRMDNMKGNFKKTKYERERERDVSEKIALGLHAGAQKLEGEGQFDSRLFNQSSGMDSGFGHEDEYNVYSKPMFDRGSTASVYRPKRDDSEMYGDADDQYKKLSDTSKFKPDKGFRGAESDDAHARDGPVQFQKELDSREPDSRQTKRQRRGSDSD